MGSGGSLNRHMAIEVNRRYLGSRAPRFRKNLAVACRRYDRIAWRVLFSAIRSKLALLDCAHAAHCRDLVFRGKFAETLAAQPIARVHRWHRFFYRNI